MTARRQYADLMHCRIDGLQYLCNGEFGLNIIDIVADNR